MIPELDAPNNRVRLTIDYGPPAPAGTVLTYQRALEGTDYNVLSNWTNVNTVVSDGVSQGVVSFDNHAGDGLQGFTFGQRYVWRAIWEM